jgi:hypothetical protein
LSPEEFVATATAVALLSHQEGKLKLCGEAYEVLVYLSLKMDHPSQVSKFIDLDIDQFPAEVLDGVLRGLTTYDSEMKVDTGRRLLHLGLGNRELHEIEREAEWRSWYYRFLHFLHIIEKPALGAAIGLLIGQILSSIVFKQ